MELKERRKSAKLFAERWANRGDEKQHTQIFWIELLHEIYNIDNPTAYIDFELPVKNMKTSNFIDGYIEKTKVLIEQKSMNINLDKGEKQSDGSLLSPFQQAFRYNNHQPYDKKARWIIVSNFQEFRIHDMNNPYGTPAILKLADLEKEYYRLDFLIDKTNDEIERQTQVSIEAGELIGEIYSELMSQYNDPTNVHTLESINILSVRLVFCFYAEDAGLFGRQGAFREYLEEFSTSHFRNALIELFKVLDTPIAERDPYIDEKLGTFPYVNGGLFSERTVEIPNFTEHLQYLILKNASSDFDWSEISPTIFGGVFESTLNPEQRRKGGMHYTSIENIHKLIDPLFLNDLKEELADIQQMKQVNRQKERALEFQNKLANMIFFDPACGSGNFLTETYLSLRELENQVFVIIYGDSTRLGVIDDFIKISLNQFYGIEINDFAVSVAKTALWIAESQMFEKTKELVYLNADFLPLKSYVTIVEGNALTTNWNNIVDSRKVNYIIGNPPFIGARLMVPEQTEEIKNVFNNQVGVGNLDYVSGWYRKTAEYIQQLPIQCAFVSTNSITQGQQVSLLWDALINDYGIVINFAYRTFKWESEATDKAAVHCVIIGFSNYRGEKTTKVIYKDKSVQIVKHINPYLLEAPDVIVKSRSNPLCDVPKMNYGSMPNDGKNLLLTVKEKNELLHEEPRAKKYIRRLYGSEEFINNKERYCLWLVDIEPHVLRSMPSVLERVRKVKEHRLNSKRKATKQLADVPYLFGEIRQPNSDYLFVPRVSSENRRYIPIGYMKSEDITSDSALIVPNADLYTFGVMTSNVHMGWMRAVAGRLKSDYRYSKNIVYNNFPWPNVTEEQKELINKTAQNILDIRTQFPNSSYADLYDEVSMPINLRKAHQENDKAVMRAYNMDIGPTTEADAVSHLFNLYAKLI